MMNSSLLALQDWLTMIRVDSMFRAFSAKAESFVVAHLTDSFNNCFLQWLNQNWKREKHKSD